MMTLDRISTKHEELHEKLHRIQGEAWGEYANWPEVSNDAFKGPAVHFRAISSLPKNQDTRESTERVFFLLPTTPTVSGRGASHYCEVSEAVRHGLAALQNATEKMSQICVFRDEVAALLRETLLSSTKGSRIPQSERRLRRFTERQAVSDWTDAKNDRRCELVDKEIDGTLTTDERNELELLQTQMLAYRRRVAPLPLGDVRRLHQQLLRRAQPESE